MPSRKRNSHAANGDCENPLPSCLSRIRNMWQFANLCQWIYIFGKAAKLDDSIDIEGLETDCLKPQPTLLPHIALALLKLVSSHRGLTSDILDDQLRKQYLTKAPEQNPLGDETQLISFASLDVFTKIKVLQKLTQWTMAQPERLREKMEEHKDVEQTNWRIEPYGWDRQDRTYFVLDDDRIYRFTEAPDMPPQPKVKKSRHHSNGHRARKRPRVSSSDQASHGENMENGNSSWSPTGDDLGGGTWECVAVTLQEAQAFLEPLKKTRDENEKVLRKQVELHLLPILERKEEAMKRKQLQHEREMLNLAKMANAKRSSRIADKAEKQRKKEEESEIERQRFEADAAERRAAAAQLKLEKERDFRLFARQRRLQERESRRLRHEEELAQLSEDSRNVSGEMRISERRLHAEIEREKNALEELEQEEEEWIFDCICGLHGHVDDGQHSVACDQCNIWQHSKCLGISKEEAEQSEFQFVCSTCKRREVSEIKTPRTVIKLKIRPTNFALESSEPNEIRAESEGKNATLKLSEIYPIQAMSPSPIQEHVLPVNVENEGNLATENALQVQPKLSDANVATCHPPRDNLSTPDRLASRLSIEKVE